MNLKIKEKYNKCRVKTDVLNLQGCKVKEHEIIIDEELFYEI